MERTVQTIQVKDENGVTFKVIKRERTEAVGTADQTRKVFSLELDTGEPGTFTDQDTFRLTGTGETFSRVHRKRTPRENA